MPTLEWIGESKVINHYQEDPIRRVEHKYSFDENGQYNEDNCSKTVLSSFVAQLLPVAGTTNAECDLCLRK